MQEKVNPTERPPEDVSWARKHLTDIIIVVATLILGLVVNYLVNEKIQPVKDQTVVNYNEIKRIAALVEGDGGVFVRLERIDGRLNSIDKNLDLMIDARVRKMLSERDNRIDEQDKIITELRKRITELSKQQGTKK